MKDTAKSNDLRHGFHGNNEEMSGFHPHRKKKPPYWVEVLLQTRERANMDDRTQTITITFCDRRKGWRAWTEHTPSRDSSPGKVRSQHVNIEGRTNQLVVVVTWNEKLNE